MTSSTKSGVKSPTTDFFVFGSSSSSHRRRFENGVMVPRLNGGRKVPWRGNCTPVTWSGTSRIDVLSIDSFTRRQQSPKLGGWIARAN
jgi:hypothetical protein